MNAVPTARSRGRADDPHAAGGIQRLPTGAEGSRRLRAAAGWLPAILAISLGGWRITEPSLWRDESVSGVAARLPLSYLRQLLGDIDAVHALYYLLLRPFAAVGTSELMLRLPSLLAFAATAYGVAVLGRRLAGPLAGLYSGVIYAVLPMASRYAQEARSYAIVSAVAVLATWLLVQALDSGSKRWHVGYAASVVLLGSFHLYALLLLAAHAVGVWLAGPRRILPWILAVAGAGAALLPLVVMAAGQREAQLFWLKTPGLGDLAGFPGEIVGGAAAAVLLVSLAVCGAWWSRETPIVVLWAVVPVLASFLISQVYPIYHARYVLFVVPAIALLAGIGLHALASAVRGHLAVPVGAILLLGALTAGAHVAMREPGSRPDDLRSLAATLTTEQRPGDGVLFVPRRFRLFVSVYGEPYRWLTDLTHEPGLYEPRTAAQFAAAATGVDRIWLISPRLGARYRGDPRLQVLQRTLVAGPTRTFGSIHLTLYTRESR